MSSACGRSIVLLSISLFAGLPSRSRAQDPVAVPEAPSPAGFFSRLGAAYHADWHPDPNASPADAPARRGLPSPLSSPPFPAADWSYGGSPVIGEPDTSTYPLMSAIIGAKSRTKIYGWFEPSVNGSTSRDSNSPELNDVYSNRVELSQFVVYIERLPDTVQQDHVDWGFHLTSLVGTDYRFTTGKGYFSQQYIDHQNLYGFDPSLEYVDLYLPKVAKGMNLRLGRYISIPGIEAQLAPNNYTFSHSLLYAIDPFTDTGLLATVKLSDQWLVQGGISAGHDVAPWATGAKPSGTVCLDYTTKSVDDNFYFCANGINSGVYAYDNLQQYDGTWYHRFSKSVHMASEAWYMYMRDVPANGGPIKPEANTNGAACLPGQLRCTAPEYAAVNFLQDQLSPHDFLSLRNDFLNDKKGQRTGFQTRYSEATLSWTHWIGSTVQLRPEIRFDHAWDRRSYDNGRDRNQLTVASDVIFHF